MVTVSDVRNDANHHFDTNLYLILNEVTALPDSWDYQYSAVGESSGVFVNGEKQAGAIVKHANGNDIHYGFPGTPNEGDVVEFKGTFATTSDGGYAFSIDFTTKRFGSDWILELEDYDVLSLKDANIPDFENVSINTEDASAYAYTTDKGTLPKRNGYFGLTNDTGSYAFQFNLEVDGKMTKDQWLTFRIGASGGWTTGHYLKFSFTNCYHDDGCVVVSENEGTGDYATHRVEVRTDISDGRRLIKIGGIKVKGTSNTYYVFVLNNGTTSFGRYWELASGTMSTRVGIYAPDTNLTLANSLDPDVTTTLTLSAISSGSALYFNTTSDPLPFVNTWADYFIPQDSTGFTYNGVDASSGKINYFKKVGATSNAFYLGFGDLGITPVSGDYFHLGGMFKQVHIVNGVAVLYKVVIQDCDFQFDGTKWAAYDPDYTAEDFSKDLLKLTLSICLDANDGNHDALVSVWVELANDSHFGLMQYSQQDLFKNGTGGPGISVPGTTAGIDAMSSSDAIGAALYRYDYCTAKYSLTNFVGRTLTVTFGSNLLFAINLNLSQTNTFIIVISIISLVSVSMFGLYIYKRKREQN